MPSQPIHAVIANASFDLELAADDETRARGLGGRASLAPNEGMLFVFAQDEWCEFVMRDCVIPLDLLYLDQSGVIIALHTMNVEPPRSASEKTGEAGEIAYVQRLPVYPSGQPCRFAIEVCAGSIDALHIRAGDRVHFDLDAARARAR